MVATAKKFSGILADPIAIPLETLGAEAAAEDHLLQVLAKLPDLFTHYDIPQWNNDGSRNDLLLVLALARDFVPGFQLRRPERRGRRKDLAADLDLLADVGRIKEKRPNLSVSAIAKILTGSKGKRKYQNKRSIENKIGSVVRDPEVYVFLRALLAASQKK